VKHVLLKVRNSIEGLEEPFFQLNNIYVGYVGWDSQHVRSLLEWRGKKIPKTREFLVYAEWNGEYDSELHKINCDSVRFSKSEAEKLIKKFGFKKTNSKTWVKIKFPNKNSSKIVLVDVKTDKIVYNEFF
jgi:hypothetical protein